MPLFPKQNSKTIHHSKVCKKPERFKQRRLSSPNVIINQWQNISFPPSSPSNYSASAIFSLDWHLTGEKTKTKDNLNRAKFVRDKDLIGTTHSSSFVTLGKVGSEPKPTFGVLDHSAEIPPSLQHFVRRMFCLHRAKVLVQIRLHCLWAMILPLFSGWLVNFCKIRINTMNDLCVLCPDSSSNVIFI